MYAESQPHFRIAMTSTLRQLTALLFSTAILITGNGLINTLLPVRAEIEAFSTLEIGLLGTVYFAGFILGCVSVPRLVRRVGHIRTFGSLASAAAATSLLYVFWIDPFAWGVLRFIGGFGFAGLYVVIESWLNDRAGASNRGSIMSIYTFISLSVLMVGQFLLTTYDAAGFELFGIVAILMTLALVPVSLTRSPEPPRPAGIGLDIPGLWRLSPVGFAGCLSVGLVNGSFWSLGPVFARRSGLDIDNLVYFIAASTFAGAIMQWPLGRLSDRIDRRFVIVAAALMAAASGVLLGAWVEPSTTLLIGLSAAFGGFAMPLYAVSVAHANDLAEDTRFVATAGGLLLIYGFGASLGPLIASALMGYVGGEGLFMFTTAVHAALALFATARLALRPRAKQDDQAGFVAMPRTSPTLFELDPRSEAESEGDARR